MATKKGAWNLQQVRDKKLKNLWSYASETNLYVWGRNEHGQLGLNQAPSLAISSPTQVPGTWGENNGMIETDRRLSARDYVLNIRNDGSLWGWGLNNKGQLGQGNTANKSSPIQIGGGFDWASLGDLSHYAVSCATKTDGTLWFWGDGDSKHQYGAVVDRSSPTQVPGTTWSASFTGYDNSGALKTDGTLWTWGTNGYGQLGHNSRTDTNDPTQVGSDTTWSSATGGYKYNFGLKTDGTLWAWGENDNGALGLNQTNPGTGANSMSSPTQVPGTTWTQKISSGVTVTLAIKTDGTLWTWGKNEYGQLGQNNVTLYSSPVQIPGTNWDKVAVGNYYQMFGIKTDGTLWTWGDNRYGSLAINSEVKYSSPVQIPGTWETVIGAGTDNGGVALKN